MRSSRPAVVMRHQVRYASGGGSPTSAAINRAEELFQSGGYFCQPTLPGSRNGCEAAGEGVTAYAPGDLVLTAANYGLGSLGVYGDRVLPPASALVPRPADVDEMTAAAVWVTYSTAYCALVERSRMALGSQVLITGASSGVGTAAIQVVRRAVGVFVAQRVRRPTAVLQAVQRRACAPR